MSRVDLYGYYCSICNGDIMKYRIMITAANRQNGDNLYKYYYENNELFETEDVAELDRKVEELFETYTKNQINIISPIDYVIDALIDVSDIYINNITGEVKNGILTYTMSGKNIFANEEYTWIMNYDGEMIEVKSIGLTRNGYSDEMIKFNSSSLVKACIKKDNYISEIFIIK